MEAQAPPEPKLPGAAGWRPVWASVRGRSHEQRRQPCQDAAGVIVTENGTLIAAVADGAGSAARAEEGSAVAVATALHALAQAIGEPLDPPAIERSMAAAFGSARDAIAAHAAEQNAPIAAFHTTLLCAVVTEEAVTVGHIGDGIAVIETADGRLETIALPEHGEFANSTYFLTQLPQLAERFHTRSIKPAPSAIALTTDGLLDVAFSEPNGACEPWEPFFSPLFERVRQAPSSVDLTPKLAGLLGSAKIREQTSDDVTLVLAVRQVTDQSGEQAEPVPAEADPSADEDDRSESVPPPEGDPPVAADADDAAMNDDVSASR